MPIHRLILNADDFGRIGPVNEAIVSAMVQGHCTNTTIMANMPGFAEAATLAREHGFADRVGVHLNLYEGEPLTKGIRQCPRICGADGLFLQKRRPRLMVLETGEKAALAAEILAQVHCCRRAGLPLSHLDSHCHIHNEWGVAGLVVDIARKTGIPRIRLCRHRDPASVWWKNGYRLLVNLRLRGLGLAGSDYFGTVADGLRLHAQIRKPFTLEVMLHPTLDGANQVGDYFLPGTLAANVGTLLALPGVTTWCYRGAAAG